MSLCSILGQEPSSSETRSSNMVSLRKHRLRSPSPPPSDGTDPCISELKPIQVHEIQQDFSDQSLEQSSTDHESEVQNNAHQSEDQAYSVPETVLRRTPLDQVEPRVMSMSSTLARSRLAKRVWLEPDLNQKRGGEVLVPSTELQLCLGREHIVTALPTVKFKGAGDHEISEDAEEDSVESMGSGDKKKEKYHEAPEIMSSGESSDRSLETRYLDSWRETPSVSSRRRGRATFKRGNSIELPECRSVDGEINVARDQRIKNYSRKRPFGGFKRKHNRVKVSAPAGSSGHYLRSSAASEGADADDEPPEEGSLMHSVFSVVMVCGQEGISEEDVLVSLHGQAPPATLAHTDWEADAKVCLRSRLFAQVQGQFVLRQYHRCHRPPTSSQGKEQEPHSGLGEAGMQGRRKFKGMKVQGRLSMGIIKDHGVGGRGSLRAKQKLIEEENGIQEGARQCALTASLHKKTPWQCPLMAMHDHKLCEYHMQRREITKMKARALRERKNFEEGEFIGGSATT